MIITISKIPDLYKMVFAPGVKHDLHPLLCLHIAHHIVLCPTVQLHNQGGPDKKAKILAAVLNRNNIYAKLLSKKDYKLKKHFKKINGKICS